jgi:Domain of unknown function (DUF5615)
MLAFYMDHQFRASVTRGLRQRGVDVLTAFEDGRHEIDDESLLARATTFGRQLVTHDKGFLRIGARWQKIPREFSGIVFAAQDQLDIGRTIDYLECVSRILSADEMRNRIEYIPSR